MCRDRELWVRGGMGREFTPHSPEPGPWQAILLPSQHSTSGAPLEQGCPAGCWPCRQGRAGAGHFCRAMLRGCSGTDRTVLPAQHGGRGGCEQLTQLGHLTWCWVRIWQQRLLPGHPKVLSRAWCPAGSVAVALCASPSPQRSLRGDSCWFLLPGAPCPASCPSSAPRVPPVPLSAQGK